MYEKLKSIVADDAIFTVIVVLLVGLVSFGLGRESVMSGVSNNIQNQTAGIVFYEAPVTETVHEKLTVVASKSGTRYHLPSCPGAKQIKESNKISFASTEQARAAGYTPAANCPELK